MSRLARACVVARTVVVVIVGVVGVVGVGVVVGCRPPVAGIELVVEHDVALDLDQLAITVSPAAPAVGGAPAARAVVVPEAAKPLEASESVGVVIDRAELVGVEVVVDVDGRGGGVVLAHGDTHVVTVNNDSVDARVILGALFTCGDGAIGGTELCDDENVVDGDGCTAACEVEAGFTCVGEPSACARCGDGVVQTGEGCDDLGFDPGDGCAAACAVEPGYACDGAPSSCAPVCGDGVVLERDGAALEVCDDGNGGDDDGCSSVCALEDGFDCLTDVGGGSAGAPATSCFTRCGDGLVVGDEVDVGRCDDHNNAGGDGCADDCTVELGYTCGGEPSVCATECGDEIVAGGEVCDDGVANSDSAPDACRLSCTPARCGDNVADTGEQCDDGDVDNHDACTAACKNAVCGDGFVGPGEACDDGDAAGTGDGDGCSATCALEGGFVCGGEPTVCAAAATSHVVDGGGTGEFTTLADAVDSALVLPGDTLFVTGDTSETASIDVQAKSLVIVGAAGVLVAGTSGGATLHLRCPTGTPCTIDVHGLTFTATASQDALLIDQAGTTATFTGTTFGPTGKAGVELKSGQVSLTSCVVTGNTDGGLNFSTGGSYVVESTAIVGNGNSNNANFGGADLKNAGTFRFNTVAGNVAKPNATATGVNCRAVTTLIERSIVVDDGATIETNANCETTTSLVGVGVDVGFDGGATFHLDAGSSAIDAGGDTCPARDVDGEARPIGAHCDVGADERPR